MKTFFIIFLAVIGLSLAYVAIWNKYFQPIRKRRWMEYAALYSEIHGWLQISNLNIQELETIRLDIKRLEKMKYKNKEMSDFIAAEWMRKKYGMKKHEMEGYHSVSDTAKSGI